jgi:hypothetical protein
MMKGIPLEINILNTLPNSISKTSCIGDELAKKQKLYQNLNPSDFVFYLVSYSVSISSPSLVKKEDLYFLPLACKKRRPLPLAIMFSI